MAMAPIAELSGLHRDAPGLARLGLADLDLQHALVVLGGHLVGVGGIRQREAAEELAVNALHPIIVLLVAFGFGLALALDGQRAILQGDFHVLGIHARQAVGRREIPTIGWQVISHTAAEHAVEFLGHVAEEIPRFITCEIHGIPPRNTTRQPLPPHTCCTLINMNILSCARSAALTWINTADR